MNKEPLIQIKHANKLFKTRNWRGQLTEVQAVNDVSLTIYKGETVGLVGESGSGKTTLGRGILQLEPFTSGQVLVDGEDVQTMTTSQKQTLAQEMQIIFQDPYSALNPQMTALELVMEPLFREPKELAREKALALLKIVGIEGEAVHKYPRAFSGGQRQRIGIARAVVGQPRFILCDEPTSALDVSIQAQIMALLVRLQREYALSYLFISHDLSVIRHISDRIAVMYQGQLVELASTRELFEHPQHAYTKKLLAAAPVADPKLARRQMQQEQVQEIITLGPDFEWKEVRPNHFVRSE
ncbi:ATP-binding cassette domain-containing protein [Enterococcus camelliae]|jgi:ABC-type oligopeptide transport system ATPase subunit|uniref:ATP-binding cassette domain-containing protein n=1 Tax=Enterococcus camelliae TaxID=453959 RepID=A0ABW5TGX6_9ENTE